jgi:(1->4)-alpha-D-glucan 1-alpha-D-glucosylmutase
MTMPELRATARVQLHRDFDLDAAAAQVPYYAALGISHLYLSPIGTARPGSLHGYDVIDPTRINPELGGEPAFRRLSAALRAHAMGAIMDIVPNHMAADLGNPWWHDVLACGRRAAHADYFDIDWDAPGADGRVCLPILERPLDEMIARGDLQLAISAPEATIELACGGQPLPLSREGLAWLLQTAGIAGRPSPTREHALACCAGALRGKPADRLAAVIGQVNAQAARMDQLLDLQHYRLMDWRRGNSALNYRRFFDISALVALSVERREVFDAVHALPLRLLAEGLVDGLRIDHVDGLSRPAVYLRRLRSAVAAVAPAATIHVEKILAHDEPLRRWPIDGSTGYDFMDQVGALLHDPAGAAPLRLAWARISGRSDAFDEEERQARGEALADNLAAEFGACLRAWTALLSPTDAAGAPTAVGAALRDLLLQMRVYRTYLGSGAARPQDAAVLSRAFDAAERHGTADHREARAALRCALLLAWPARADGGSLRALRLARRRFEQLSAPLNAKSVEDTGFYRYGVLLSRNEVGSDPRHFAITLEAFHRAARQRAEAWPRAMLASATHDHKRGEDARARLAVLSERASDFVGEAGAWLAGLASIDPLPDAADRWMLLQTLLAAWPLDLGANAGDQGAGADLRDFAGRIGAWQRKAIREAGLRSSWTSPDEAYENACQRLVDVLLCGDDAQALRHDIAAAAHRLDAPGALNGLAATTLKLTVPGVPDLYQGTERWDQSLVDPDNRRPVDYALRRGFIDAGAADPEALLRDFRDGRVKQWLIRRLLQLRQQQAALLLHGSYEPLTAIGSGADRVVAFVRRHGAQRLLVAVPRLCANRLGARDLPLVPALEWNGTALTLSARDASCTWRDVFTDVSHRADRNQLPLPPLLDRFPVAVLAATHPHD